MTNKQERFYLKFAKAGGTSDEMKESVAKGEYTELAFKVLDSMYSIAKKGRKKHQLFALFSSVEGRKLVKGAESAKRGGKTSEKITSSNIREKKSTNPNMGRPCGYSQQCNKVAKYLLARGGTDTEVQDALDISKTTYYRWKIDYPEFHAAVRAGRDFYEVDQVEASLIKRAKGFEVPYHEIEYEMDDDGKQVITKRKRKVKIFAPDTNANKFFLNNRSPDRYSENPEPKSDSDDLKNHDQYMANLEESVAAAFGDEGPVAPVDDLETISSDFASKVKEIKESGGVDQAEELFKDFACRFKELLGVDDIDKK